MSYHDGSIWPHDNALIALGFARYGLKRSVGASVQGTVRRRELHGFAAAAGIVLRISAGATAWAGALSRGLCAAGLGERDGPSPCWRRRSVWNSCRARRDPASRSALPEFLSEVTLRDLQLGLPAST